MWQYKEYQKELGKESNTETYIKIKFNLNNREVEFETGKKYPQKESFIEIDGSREEVNPEKADYVNLFDSFFKQKHESFPTIEESVINWEIIEKIEKDKPEIFFY
ncbi:MAG: hypothetical protein NTZ83_06740, partial [Candidatus Pacearchaeota archaeon]|nr:hypothetical protein [Candidatus Pacearchaeota archaeon]